MTPVIEAKQSALAEYKRSATERNLQILRAARNKVQRTARRCANEYWMELSKSIQMAAATGDIRGMYDDIKKALADQCRASRPPSNHPLGMSLLTEAAANG
ncbi:hypothetical protein Pmani_001325 [Petrolisthes manimaculis]|uniref:Uncharacterized protein n=1 Tax=Petrolisthes manimaculis TaxID=1843537 RepID=A0AAE1UKD1_9EUCA|nr:hypothetical protein Pmani_001325 [Petrolisthes manimaculis]